MIRTLALAALAAAGTSVSAQNLLSNGGFESPDASGGDVAGAPAPWLGFNDPNTQFVTASQSFEGDQSLKTFGPFDFIGGGTGMVQQVPAVAGAVYSGSIQAQHITGDALAGGNFGVFKIEFLDSNGLLVGGLGQPAGTPLIGFNVFESNQFNASNPLDTWTELGVGGVAPAGSVTLQAVIVQVQLGDGAGGFTGGAIYWDAATVVPAPATAAFLALGGLAATRRRR